MEILYGFTAKRRLNGLVCKSGHFNPKSQMGADFISAGVRNLRYKNLVLGGKKLSSMRAQNVAYEDKMGLCPFC